MSRVQRDPLVAGGPVVAGGRVSGKSVPTYRLTDPSTPSDRQRIRKARAIARDAVRDACSDGSASRREAFRDEVGATVRSASPFLLSLVASVGEQVDGLLVRMNPGLHWPRYPALSSNPASRFQRLRETPRRFVIATPNGDKEAVRRRGFGHTVPFIYSGRDWACLEVVEHSLEIEARIGPARLETLFGVLRVELDDPLPTTVAAATIGRRIGDVVSHTSLRGHPWPIVAVEEPPSPSSGQTLVVETGSVAFRMPWVR